MRPRKTLFAALAVSICVTAVGCGERQPQNAEPLEQPPGPGLTSAEVQREDATTRWAEGYCLAVGELVRSMSTIPMIDPSTTQRATRTSSELLGTMITGLDRTVSRLRDLAEAPVPAGERVRAKAISEYNAIRDRAAAVKQTLDAAAQDPAASRQAISAAGGPLDEIGKVNLLAGFESVPELATARERAQACRDLTKQGPEPRLGY
ncbi:hypothetical protein SAMN05216266_104303 [Amycolatopsis marina]|uniref:Lipoprotein n=1 Tax=Amycolatopsis marina TaxID=490629 RepID=A0A1I0YAI5_9PSEU|nr:hypothetical protein [Amycolatopsis marina]SFB09428.1 hypothetical protein SAMN05216266_104303 [Amycolatopsis marina]